MGLSIKGLLNSPLAERYDMTSIATWRGSHDGSVKRVLVFAASLLSLTRWCLRRGPGIVHVHAAVRGSWYRKGVVVVLAKLMRRPVVLQLRVGPGDIVEFDERLGRVRRAAFRRLFAMPEKVISVSTVGAREVERRFGRGGIALVTNPAPEPRYDPVPENGHVNVLYIGGFYDPAKGGDVLLAALPGILARHPGVQITLAGPGEPPEAGRRLIEEREEITWLGWLDDEGTAAAFDRSAVFVLPSRSEGMPNAMLEAMANGRAVVATDVGGVPDVVTDGADGLIVPPGQPEPVVEATCRLLDDAELRARLGIAARERAQRLTRDEVWGELDSVYQSLV